MIKYYKRIVNMDLFVKVSGDDERICKKVADSCFRQALERLEEPEYICIDGISESVSLPVDGKYTIWRPHNEDL